MIKTESKEIGTRGYTYTVKQFGAREGGRMLVRLAKMLGKPVGDAVSAGESLDIRVAGSVIGGLAESVTEDEFDRLCTSFAKCSTVHGGDAEQPAQLQYGRKAIPLSDSSIFDLHFAGAYVELVGWLMFALEVNFGSFLAVADAAKTDLLSGLRASDGAAESASPLRSPPISKTSGQSGASQVPPTSVTR